MIRGYHVYKYLDIKLNEVPTLKKDYANIHDRFACDVHLSAAFILLLVNVGGGV